MPVAVLRPPGVPEKTPPKDPSATYRQSQRALDGAAFCLADVADGLGPFLVIYLTTQRHWTSGEAGLAMSLMLVGTVLSQTFVGAWIDQTRYKRLAVAMSAVFVAASCIFMYHLPNRVMIYGLQLATGVAVTVFPPALAAISLGFVGRPRLPARAGRNEACFHAGNVVAALLAIGGSWCFGSAGVFYGVAVMAIGSAVSVLLIHESDIDHHAARGADGLEGDAQILPWVNLLRDPRIICFTAAVVLFHFANAAMLPLVGQKVGHQLADKASALMGACIIVAQLTMVPVAILASRAAVFGRRPVFLIGFAILPLRGLCYTLTDNPWLLIANQILDGIGAGIFGVVALLMMADMTKGTGRFNFAQGLVATAIGLGAALSNVLTGLIVDAAGYNAGFWFLTTVAVAALCLFTLTVQETLETTTESGERSQGVYTEQPR
ncbi:MAG: MFS transporter [Planctomycetota bacterium]